MKYNHLQIASLEQWVMDAILSFLYDFSLYLFLLSLKPLMELLNFNGYLLIYLNNLTLIILSFQDVIDLYLIIQLMVTKIHPYSHSISVCLNQL